MLNNKTIAVVIPAYNEETQIGMVIESMPDFVDRIIIVNDCSKDRTADVVKEYIAKDNSPRVTLKPFPKRIERNRYNEAEMVLQESNEAEHIHYVPSEVVNINQETDRIILINNLKNGGVGAGIARGYKWCKDHMIDCTAVMAGDGQMDPAELESICAPVIYDNVDYVKGNRLIHRSAKKVIPTTRFIGNSILSILTKIASGYWRVSDTQTGYTAISLTALQAIDIYKIYRSYGMPNDLLVKLNIVSCSIKEVEIKPVYRVGEQSKMKVFKVIPRVSWLLIKLFFKRLWTKYLFRDFHPLFLFYNFSFLLWIATLPYLVKIIKAFIYGTTLSHEPLLAFFFLFTASFQSLIFAMWMDIQDNERLYK
ncbi:MAG: glycosyltransferase family 2 protein [Bacteroidetes bacterium]|nr:MAG: glycosyltransferase family 2 protein [Bacteroidota bacterium]REJ99667.1 MAG: glycosyltransferase family 2 protein [Bacteroidota bacterium]REK33900.1 MAG: glycosyltransferase family 2 protein [Bacteroidota bacterium]REK47665.1 MAG: glycosyltransferase family 2 protein [Bacteroidota bacterium]